MKICDNCKKRESYVKLGRKNQYGLCPFCLVLWRKFHRKKCKQLDKAYRTLKFSEVWNSVFMDFLGKSKERVEFT